MLKNQTEGASAIVDVPAAALSPSPLAEVQDTNRLSGADYGIALRTLRRASLWVMFLLVACFVWLDYWAYSADSRLYPNTYTLLLQGKGPAPNQYRIGLVVAASVLHHAHLAFRYSFALFDFISAFGALYLLLGVLTNSSGFRASTTPSRWMRIAVLLCLVSFYFSWSLWYQRPETMASALFVACSLYLLTVARSRPLIIAGLLILSVVQGFIRADVAILFHFGLFVFVLIRGSKNFSASRTVLLLTSFVACVLPTVTLWLLMHKIYPHASYGDTAVFQLKNNLSPRQLTPFLLFMVPTLYTYRRGLGRFSWLEGPHAALLLVCLLYLCSWAVLGRLQEVRIFVPFAMALMPLTANLVADEVNLPPA